MKTLYLYGAGGHGKVVIDIAKSCGYDDIIIIDDGENIYPSFEEVKHNIHIPIALGIGTNITRKIIYKKVKSFGFRIVTLIHPTSIISENVIIGEGSVIMPQVTVNCYSSIGKGAILNTGSIIEHDNNIEDFVHISPGTALAGNVTVGELSHIGIGSCLIQGIQVGSKSVIGAGSVVVKNIPFNTLAYGNPCKVIKELA